jgi:hypothetical protein
MNVSSGSIKKRYKALNTDKVHIKNTKIFLSDIAGPKNRSIVPRELQNKVTALLGKKDYKSVVNSPRYKATFVKQKEEYNLLHNETHAGPLSINIDASRGHSTMMSTQAETQNINKNRKLVKPPPSKTLAFLNNVKS